MSSFTVPSEFASLLDQFKEPIELRDTAGKLIGLFTPHAKGEPAQAHWSAEEAERIWQEQRDLPWYTLDEIWRKLGRTASAPE
jgi:hypothetical protein